MAKKKKRRLKKKFKVILWFLILVLILGGVFYLNNQKIISLENIWKETNNQIVNIKNLFQKDKKVENEESNSSEVVSVKENDFIKIFRNRLPSKNLNFASSSEILPNGDMKIFLQNTQNDEGYLFVNTNQDAEYVWITFVSAIDAEPLKTEIEKKIKDLDYIDLRFSNKVFYKFHNKNEIPATPVSTEEVSDLEGEIIIPIATTTTEISTSTNLN